MKKYISGIFLLGFLTSILLLPLSIKAAPAINVTFDPATAKVGDKVTLTIQVTDTPSGAEMTNLYMTQMNSQKPGELEPYLKQSFNPYSGGTSSTYTYVWDTGSAGSQAGSYNIVVLVLGKIVDGQRSVLLSSQPYTYTLSAGPGGGGGGGGAGTGGTTGGGGTSGTKCKPSLTILPDTDPATWTLDNIQCMIENLITIAADLAGGIAIILLIWAGIQYFTAYGNEEKANKAKTTITWAIIGLVFIILARVLSNEILGLLK